MLSISCLQNVMSASITVHGQRQAHGHRWPSCLMWSQRARGKEKVGDGGLSSTEINTFPVISSMGLCCLKEPESSESCLNIFVLPASGRRCTFTINRPPISCIWVNKYGKTGAAVNFCPHIHQITTQSNLHSCGWYIYGIILGVVSIGIERSSESDASTVLEAN